MMKKERTKEMTGQELTSKNKSGEVSALANAGADAKLKSSEFKKPEFPTKIRCIRECVMPGVGHFNHGEVVADEGRIARIADNPNFEIVSEEEQP